jgi:anhydro-N-acetylmuramic acid kinase
MNKNLESLYRAALKPSRRIIGLMSGTSLDGLDVALCEVSGAGEDTRVVVVHFETVSYSDDIKNEIRRVFAKQTIDFQHLTLLNAWLGSLQADMILDCLNRWGVAADSIDAIASHGQTVMHAPNSLHGLAKFSNATLQIGDGCHIAVRTGITTISDFRQKHVAAGGEGAPLAVYGDYFLFGKQGESRILLNMGGIANFTYLPASMNAEDVFVTDTGPGNTLLDAITREFFPQLAYDKDAALALAGQVNLPLLAALKAHPFFKLPFPKTTGPELFSRAYIFAAQRQTDTLQIAAEDLLATLTQFSAETIAEAILAALKSTKYALADFTIYLSGGGMHNPLLVATLKKLLPCQFSTTNAIGISGDAKEAVLFAVLANETIAGGASDFGARRGIPSVTMGKISFAS